MEAASALGVATIKIIMYHYYNANRCFFLWGLLCPGLAAPVLAEVLYDRGGRAAPLLVFGPIMILTAIFAGESWGHTFSVYSFGVSAVRRADVFDGLQY